MNTDTPKPVLDPFDQSVMDDLEAQVAAGEITLDQADRLAEVMLLPPLPRSGDPA